MKENESQNDQSAAKKNDPTKEEVQARARGVKSESPMTTVPRDEEPNTTVPRDID